MKKFTVLTTLRCNLRCRYCYILKRDSTLSLPIAERIVDFIYRNTPRDEKIDLGFFGGEPLLEFSALQKLVEIVQEHPAYDPGRIELSVTTNGTLFSSEIAAFLTKHRILFCVSCDGPPHVQDLFRVFPDNSGSSTVVEKTIQQAKDSLPIVLVNAVYHPQTVQHLPETIQYLSALGLRQIYLNPDFSASWTKRDVDRLPEIFGKVGDFYIDRYLHYDPHFVSLIDSKVTVILRGGYKPSEKCQMGTREIAFSPEGYLYLCERLVGSGDVNEHCIGHIDDASWPHPACKGIQAPCATRECQECTLRDYCMNWCGCSNHFATGFYDRVSPFLCASEKAAIRVAFDVYQALEKELGPVFAEHVAGGPLINSLVKAREMHHKTVISNQERRKWL